MTRFKPSTEIDPRSLAPDAVPPGPITFSVVYGSHAHGTATPTSDVDLRGVYILPNDDFLGLGRPKTTWERKSDDIVFWELGHFVQLLCKGNPNIVGMLFAPLDCVVVLGTLGYELTGMRQAFLTQGFRSAYMGWIHRETRDIEKFHNAKRLSHIPRLIWELESVYTIGNMVVRPDETKRQSIIDIKTGEMDYDEAVGWIGNMILDLEELDAEVGPSLPDEPYEEMNTWLLEARRRFG
jgi:hypothetical protein